MAAIELTPKHVLPSEQQVENLEQYFKHPFPKDYRDFLLATNGGQPIGYHAVWVDDIGEEVLMHVFWGIGTVADIQMLMDISRDDLPKGFMIFADDPGGNKFLMDLSDGEPTSIYYWEKHRHFRRPKTKENTFFVADSFTEFLAKLRPWVPVENPEQSMIEE